jgi:imidazolonepropionase-like amidohydrolase
LKIKLTTASAALIGTLAFAQDAAPKTAPAASEILISNVGIFDGKSDKLSDSMNVLIQGNSIQKISAAPIATDRRADTVPNDGGGRTLMPGLAR